MKRLLLPLLLALPIVLQAAPATNTPSDAAKYWPQWRGPLAAGVAPLADPSLKWSEDSGVKWKVHLPGRGDSTPIIWGDKIFILSAAPAGKTNAAAEVAEKPDEVFQFLVSCFDRQTGKTLWQKVAREERPHEGHQANNTFASASPCTDGQVLVTFFGSRGLHCYDLDGNLKWSKIFGQMKTRMGFGEGASPALYENTVVVYWDDEGDNDFIAAFDKNTGKELWRTPRDEATGWSTPLIVDYQGKPQVIVNASGKVRGYDLSNGKEIWSCAGQTANAIPSPVAFGNVVYVTSGFRGSALYAIKLGHTGDLKGTDAILWTRGKFTPYVPSPLLVDGRLYTVANNSAIFSCFDLKTGAPQFEGERLEGISEIYASPVAAAEKIYVLGRDGTCLVLKQGPQVEILATNKLNDKTDASPAIAGNDLFIRGRQFLYCIGK
jgi:outer membrane protein assembly factor BamB